MIRVQRVPGFTLFEILVAVFIATLVMGMVGQGLHTGRDQLLAIRASLTAQETARSLVLQLRSGLGRAFRGDAWLCPGRVRTSGWRYQARAGWLGPPGQPGLSGLMPLPRRHSHVLLVEYPATDACDGPLVNAMAYYIARNAGGEPALFRRQVKPVRQARVELSPGVSDLRLRFSRLTAQGQLQWVQADALGRQAWPDLVEVAFRTPAGGLKPYRVTLVPGRYKGGQPAP